jgi:hypothetical protein
MINIKKEKNGKNKSENLNINYFDNVKPKLTHKRSVYTSRRNKLYIIHKKKADLISTHNKYYFQRVV